MNSTTVRSEDVLEPHGLRRDRRRSGGPRQPRASVQDEEYRTHHGGSGGGYLCDLLHSVA